MPLGQGFKLSAGEAVLTGLAGTCILTGPEALKGHPVTALEHGVARIGHTGAGLLPIELRARHQLDWRDGLALIEQHRLLPFQNDPEVCLHVVHVLEQLQIVP